VRKTGAECRSRGEFFFWYKIHVIRYEILLVSNTIFILPPYLCTVDFWCLHKIDLWIRLIIRFLVFVYDSLEDIYDVYTSYRKERRSGYNTSVSARASARLCIGAATDPNEMSQVLMK